MLNEAKKKKGEKTMSSGKFSDSKYNEELSKQVGKMVSDKLKGNKKDK